MTKKLAHHDKINSLVGFQIQMAGLCLNEAARTALSADGLSPAKVTALSLVGANPGCEQSALARALSINRASAMKLVNVLEDHGLVERRPGRDLRSNALYLTPSGKHRLDAMIDRLAAGERVVLANLDDAERAMLIRLLGRVRG